MVLVQVVEVAASRLLTHGPRPLHPPPVSLIGDWISNPPRTAGISNRRPLNGPTPGSHCTRCSTASHALGTSPAPTPALTIPPSLSLALSLSFTPSHPHSLTPPRPGRLRGRPAGRHGAGSRGAGQHAAGLGQRHVRQQRRAGTTGGGGAGEEHGGKGAGGGSGAGRGVAFTISN